MGEVIIPINKLVTRATAVQSLWAGVVSSRIGEQPQLDTVLGSQDSFGVVSRSIELWITQLRAAGNAPKKRLAKLRPQIDCIYNSLSALKYALDHAGNGVQWMIDQRSLVSLYLMTHAQIAALRVELQRDLASEADSAASNLGKDLDLVAKGADLVKQFQDRAGLVDETVSNVQEQATKIVEQASGVQKAAESALDDIEKHTAQSLEAAEKFAGHVGSHSEEADEALSELTAKVLAGKERISELDAFQVKAMAASAETATALERAESQKNQTAAAFNDATEKLEQSRKALNAALQNVRRQGLSGAFFEKVVEVAEQRKSEQGRFEKALLYLAMIGVLGFIIEISLGLPTTIEQWLIRLVRLVVLAAPGIWIAWLAAKRLEALNRILSDYEYKSAAALAFESYRQEIEASGGNSDLKEELLRRAIGTFGENPTRFYDSSKDVAVMPAESIIDKFRSTFSSAKQAPEK